MLSIEEINKAIKVATDARKNAFAFKTNHPFGACIVTTDREFFGGCNTEGVISSLGVCAEMSAIDHAVVHGKYQFTALFVVDDKITFPCGACLQYLSQFYQTGGEEITVFAAKESGGYETKTLSELLPNKFISASFDKKIKEYKNK